MQYITLYKHINLFQYYSYAMKGLMIMDLAMVYSRAHCICHSM